MTREEVYKLIDGERTYQDEKWKDSFDDSEWAISDWVNFIERYIWEARSYTGYPKQAMDAIRKIAALAVAAMEYNETRPRKAP